MEVLLGRYNVTDDNTEPHEQKREVNIKIEHPSFNISSLDYDFALLKLDREVELNEFVEPACLPKNPNSNFGNDQAVVTGWGSLSANFLNRN